MPFVPTPLDLPAPRPVWFQRSPLSLVICQIRFEHLGAPSDDALRRLRDAFSDDYPLSGALQNFHVQLTPGAPHADAQQGWRFASIEDGWSVSLLPDSVALETTSYDTWEDFDKRLRHVLAALAEAVAPRVEVRLGLRYVNELQVDAVTEPAGWGEFLRPELAALTTTDDLAPAAFSAQQMIQLDAGNGAILNMRHGFPGSIAEPPQQPVYLIDLDCFREGQRPLNVDELLAEADRFNTMITSLFQWCVTDRMWKVMEPRDK